MTLLILLLLLVCLFGGGMYAGPGNYRNGGIGLGTIIIIVVVIWLLTGHRF